MSLEATGLGVGEAEILQLFRPFVLAEPAANDATWQAELDLKTCLVLARKR